MSPSRDRLRLVGHNRPRLLARRFFAWTIDIFVTALANKLLMISYIDFLAGYLQAFGPDTHQKIFDHLHAIHFFILYIIFWSYQVLCWYTGGGRTLGKLITGLRVCPQGLPHQELSIEACFLRATGQLFCMATAMIFYVTIFFGKDHRGLPDWISNCQVVLDDPDQRESAKPEDILLAA